MIWIAVVLGVFLFYNFVERQHKIIFFKIVGLLLVLVGIGFGIFTWYEKFKDNQSRSAIVIEYNSHDLKSNPSEQVQYINMIFDQKIVPEIKEYWPDIPQENYTTVKEMIFEAYLGQIEIYKSRVLISDAEIVALKNWIPKKTKENEKVLYEVENNRLSSLIKTLNEQRTSATTPISKFLYGNFIYGAKKSFFLKDLENSFAGKLSPDDNLLLKNYIKLREFSYEKFYSYLNLRNDIQTSLSFKICNNKNKPLESYSFTASGHENGRSTEQNLDKKATYSTSSTDFNGDIIISPQSCNIFEWTGNYKLFNDENYKITNIQGHWKEDI